MQKNIITEQTLRELVFIDYFRNTDQFLTYSEIQNRFSISRSIIPRNAQWIGWFIDDDGTINITSQEPRRYSAGFYPPHYIDGIAKSL